MGVGYHYSDMAGTHGVLTSAEVWATDLRFLNDESELRHGIGLANECLADARNSCGDEAIANFLGLVSDVLHLRALSPNAVRRYAVCFSGDGDLLSQWRAYGGQGRGCALGFDLGILDTRHGLECSTVSYDPAHVTMMFEALLAADVEQLRTGSVPADDQRVPRAIMMAESIIDLAFWSKHPAFKDEAELRAYIYGSVPLQRVRRDEIVSYTSIPIGLADGGPRIPALVEVVLGPLVTGRAEVGLRELLLTLGYDPDGPPTITRSQIPYRE